MSQKFHGMVLVLLALGFLIGCRRPLVQKPVTKDAGRPCRIECRNFEMFSTGGPDPAGMFLHTNNHTIITGVIGNITTNSLEIRAPFPNEPDPSCYRSVHIPWPSVLKITFFDIESTNKLSETSPPKPQKIILDDRDSIREKPRSMEP
ncbi:MAG: hypothetical protein PHV34_18440 [Verrucomicrobiae bacterium]|nr:hypothetical protein [Verrucomicrobiae bacterium]